MRLEQVVQQAGERAGIPTLQGTVETGKTLGAGRPHALAVGLDRRTSGTGLPGGDEASRDGVILRAGSGRGKGDGRQFGPGAVGIPVGPLSGDPAAELGRRGRDLDRAPLAATEDAVMLFRRSDETGFDRHRHIGVEVEIALGIEMGRERVGTASGALAPQPSQAGA